MARLNSAQIIRVADAQALAQTAALTFQQSASEASAARGRFAVALSGGSTPKAMFALLAGEPYRSAIDWTRVYIFWGDERCVPPEHPDSNYRMTNEALLARVPIPPSHIFRMRGEDEPSQAAQQYAALLQQFFQPEDVPRFDLVFLGMGADGHTASLFPGTTALHAAPDEIVVANYVEKLNAHRLTLTATAINQARNIVFLVGGADKAETLRAVLHGAYQPELYPSQLIQPAQGKLIWIVDETAAAGLS
ncbi:MAG TPA: 6-phosphogluconolactonase [Blastocatellia bacterium]|nr:6-phosphogluconolactonase [Blastocatellia bacterium]